MPNTFLTLFTTYLIFPILIVVMAAVATLVAKKNGLLKNKRLIIYVLVSVVLLTTPALLGFLGHDFMPWGYIFAVGLYILAGAWNNSLLPWAFNDENLKYGPKLACTLFQQITAMLLFALVFNLCSELQDGVWKARSVIFFVLPSLLVPSYRRFLRVPEPIYDIWHYDEAKTLPDADNINHTKLQVVNVEVFKQEKDKRSTRISVKVPEEVIFGAWMKLFFDDYNKRFPASPIDVQSGGGSGWIFYVKSSPLWPNRRLDHERSVKANRIHESHLIVAKRIRTIKKQEQI